MSVKNAEVFLCLQQNPRARNSVYHLVYRRDKAFLCQNASISNRYSHNTCWHNWDVLCNRHPSINWSINPGRSVHRLCELWAILKVLIMGNIGRVWVRNNRLGLYMMHNDPGSCPVFPMIYFTIFITVGVQNYLPQDCFDEWDMCSTVEAKECNANERNDNHKSDVKTNCCASCFRLGAIWRTRQPSP